MEREYTVDDRVDRLTMRDGIFCEANVAGSGCGMEAKMWEFCGDIELCLCLVVPRRGRHERRVSAGEEGERRRGGGG
jgi:hypothetical protein